MLWEVEWDMEQAMVQMVLFFVILIGTAVPLGWYCARVMNGEHTWLTPVALPIERGFYRLMGIDAGREMDWKTYAVSVLVLNGIGVVMVFLLCMLQGVLPLNPMHIEGMSWHLAFNTALSFVTNTDWQAYSGESQMSYLTQMLGPTVQNFGSAATAIAVLFAVIRGFARTSSKEIGNFWVDFTRSFLYLLLPMSIVLAVLLASQGVPQNLSAYTEAEMLQPAVVEMKQDDGSMKEETLPKAVIPQGPAASQIAIKQIGTNGGGFFGVNSAHPLENPNQVTNFFEMYVILLIPMALCFTFGRNVHDRRQGWAVFSAMFVLLLAGLFVMYSAEIHGTPALSQGGLVDMADGNMEGKEIRAGMTTSVLWISSISATSNGSVNAMIDSFTPLGVLVSMLNIMLGEVIFGGVGCGLYGMFGFVLAAVFISGLMVGRTPEYLGKKLSIHDVRLAMLMCITVPFGILLGSMTATLMPFITESLTNSGARGLSEILYAYSSASGNNGSALGGFNANTPFINVSLGLLIILGRYVPLLCALNLAGSFSAKKKVVETEGTLSTCNGMFVFFLIIVILIIGALSFFPALSLGPIAEYFQMR